MLKKNGTGQIEILAPAGSAESVRAAIAAGADAVYMGGVRFGARAYADNPETDALCEAIDYVHLHGKRLYLTVNTLLKPEEMGNELYHYLKPYYEQGLDAVIVQDAGVLKFVAEEFPGLPVHASTQMSLTMAEGARCFEGYPVTRLVNARELGLSEIRRIKQESALELESFVHGALCYCYSGQCLMSSLIGGRSGNRGRCAQPCRLEYDGSYLLSPKDICTLDMIPELIGAGIDSFKIEGRMKRCEYAAGVTAAYRREVDRYFELGAQRYEAFHREHPEVLRAAVLDMQDLYNRGGFTNGYYGQHNGRAMMSMERPNHSGVLAAKVAQVQGNRAVLCCTENLYAQDVLEIRMQAGKIAERADAEGRQAGAQKAGADERRRTAARADAEGRQAGAQRAGADEGRRTAERAGADGRRNAPKENYEFTLGQGHAAGERFEARFTPGLPVKKGDFVYRTKNAALLERISKQYCGTEPKLRIAGDLTANEAEPARLSVSAGDVRVCVSGEIVQAAKTRPVDTARLRAALEKTGDTPFLFQELHIQTSGNIFMPVSALNALRREALSRLSAEIAGQYRRRIPVRDKEADEAPDTGGAVSVQSAADGGVLREEEPENAGMRAGKGSPVHVTVMTGEQLAAVTAAAGVDRIYYDIAAMAPEAVPQAAARAKAAGKQFFLRLPQICRAQTYDWLRGQRRLLLSAQVDGYLLRNYEELYLFAREWGVQQAGKILAADAMLYAMNAPAKQFFRELGVTEFTAPYEENVRELKELGIRDMALTVYGRLPLMTSAQCVRKNTARCLLKENRMEPVPVYITDRKHKKLPVLNFCRFCYNTVYNPECLFLLDCGEIDGLAPAALRYDFTLESGEETSGILEENRLPEHISYTCGHFRRGVL